MQNPHADAINDLYEKIKDIQRKDQFDGHETHETYETHEIRDPHGIMNVLRLMRSRL